MKTTRRGIIRTAAKLAVAAPLAAAALGPTLGMALADDDHGRGHDGNDFRFDRDDFPGRDRNIPFGFGFGRQGVPFQFARAAMMLVPVASVNGGTGGGDFAATNPGSDALGSGMVVVNGSGSGQVFVVLRGAAASATYDVQFERLNDHGREDLGIIGTDASGNFAGATPSGLGGAHRVGTFVLIRGGQDEYVTTIL